MDRKKTIIGVEELCRFPALHIPVIKARVDSGAKTSSLHAFNIECRKKAGKRVLTFDVHPIQGNNKVEISCEAEAYDRRMVKSSSGHTEYRYVINTPLKLGDRTWKVELNLTNRDSMGFRMLLGRQAMKGKYLIDPGEAFLAGEKTDDEIKLIYKKISGRSA